MNDKGNTKVGFYYREAGKQTMGPLPLGTLRVALQSGSLRENAEVSRDGNEPWLSLADVLANGDAAFDLCGEINNDKGSSIAAGEHKGVSPMMTAGLVVIALAVGALAMNHLGTSKKVEGSGSESVSVSEKVSVADVEGMARNCMFPAQCSISSSHDVEEAEVELAQQRSAGESQLKAIKLQDAKADKEKANKEYDEALKALVSAEKRAGISGQYSKAIGDYVNYGERLGMRLELTKKYKSNLDPVYRAQWNEFMHIRFKITFEEMLDGAYKDGYGAPNR